MLTVELNTNWDVAVLGGRGQEVSLHAARRVCAARRVYAGVLVGNARNQGLTCDIRSFTYNTTTPRFKNNEQATQTRSLETKKYVRAQGHNRKQRQSFPESEIGLSGQGTGKTRIIPLFSSLGLGSFYSKKKRENIWATMKTARTQATLRSHKRGGSQREGQRRVKSRQPPICTLPSPGN